jgi:hypothetical protein
LAVFPEHETGVASTAVGSVTHNKVPEYYELVSGSNVAAHLHIIWDTSQDTQSTELSTMFLVGTENEVKAWRKLNAAAPDGDKLLCQSPLPILKETNFVKISS